MDNIIDETGNVYGRITVLSRVQPTVGYKSLWNVRCECGKEWVVDRTKLQVGQKSCFECSVAIRNETKRNKNIGKKFGQLTIVQALEETAGSKHPLKLYLCQCECGKQIKATLASLRASKKSCGCTASEKTRIRCVHKYESLVGESFDSFTIVSQYRNDSGQVIGVCECGKTKILKSKLLLSGDIPECSYCKASRARKDSSEAFVGRKFGSLTVVEELPRGKNGRQWVCKCVCGNNPVVLESNLIGGNSTRCAVCRDRLHGENQIKDLAGIRFGLLTAVEIDSKNKSGNYQWKCRCDCGETTVVSSSNLLRNHTQSCGCTVSTGEELLAKAFRKHKIKYTREKKFKGCTSKRELMFDFFLPEWGWCIECDGHQHFRPVEFFGGDETFLEQKRRDAIKTSFCKENFIPLIRIPYTEYGNIDRVADSITTYLRALTSKKKEKNNFEVKIDR